MQAYKKKGSTSSFITEKKAPKPRQLLSMTLHLGYPTVTLGHWLKGLTPVARSNKAHRSHPYKQNQTELTGLIPVAKTIQTQHLTKPTTTIPH
jgi:hypothetical protein